MCAAGRFAGVHRRWFLLGLAALAVAALVLSLPATGQSAPKGTLGDARCLACHAAEGMTYVAIGAPTVVQIPQGQEFNLTFSIVVPWKHHLEQNSMSINLSAAPGLSFVGGEAPVVSTAGGELPLPGEGAHPFTVTSNTTELHVSAVFDEGAVPGVERRVLVVTAPNGRPWNSTDADQGAYNTGNPTVHLAGEALITGGPGEWTATVRRILQGPLGPLTPPGGAGPVGYTLSSGVFGNVTGVSEIYVQGPARLDENQGSDFTFRLKAAPDAPAGGRILYKVRSYAIADVPDDHPDGHPPDMQDKGLWVEWNTLPAYAAGGELLTKGGGVVAPPNSGALYSLMRSFSYAVGYGSTILVLPALVLGGTFGRASVNWLNKASLGARRRVLWHNASSFGLLAFSLVHMGLFLLEPAKAWTIGMLWGGAAIACLVLLGVTGAMQRSFVEKWGFATWRYMHFAVAILMVAFILLHLGLDGTTYKFVRDAFAGG